MTSQKISALLVVAFLLSGCQPARNQREHISGGRGRGAGNTVNSNATGSTSTQGKLWGEIIGQNDQQFNSALNDFTYPSLKNASGDDKLGYVSSQSNATTGVRFFGNADLQNTSSYSWQMKGDTAQIHIEVYDANTGKTRSDGTVIAPVVVEISKSLEDFVSASGAYNPQNHGAQLIFQDKYGMIGLDGGITNGTPKMFQGTIYYCTNETSGGGCSTNNFRVLGQFSVQACGFFSTCNF